MEWMGVKCALTDGHDGIHIDATHRYTKNVCPHGVTISEYGPMTAGVSFCGRCFRLYGAEGAEPERAAPSGPEAQRAAELADWMLDIAALEWGGVEGGRVTTMREAAALLRRLTAADLNPPFDYTGAAEELTPSSAAPAPFTLGDAPRAQAERNASEAAPGASVDAARLAEELSRYSAPAEYGDTDTWVPCTLTWDIIALLRRLSAGRGKS
jgi:hypothetical protein